MIETQMVACIIAIAIGVPVGMFLAEALDRAWYFITDLVYDIRRKIRQRRK